MEEIWVDIKGYEGLYQVSNQGRVKSLDYNNTGEVKTLKLNKTGNGYLQVNLKGKILLVHRLVAESFIPNPDNKPCVDHINTIRDDNRVENLRWVTPKENMNNELTKDKFKGENNHFYGKRHTEETKDKMRKPKSDSHRRHLSEARSIKIVQLDKDMRLINTFNSSKEASEILGFDQGHINKCCNGKRKTHKGYKWMYYEDYIKLNEKGEM